MYSNVLLPMNREINKLVAKERPTKRDVEKLETLMAKQYYTLSQALNSIHYIAVDEGFMQ